MNKLNNVNVKIPKSIAGRTKRLRGPRVWDACFQPSHYYTIGHTFREAKYHHCYRSLRRLQVVMKYDLKCSNPWTVEVFGWLVCVKWPGVLEGHRKVGKLGCSSGFILTHKKGDRNYRGISTLGLSGKVYFKCLEKRCREIIEPKLGDVRCDFRPGRGTTDKIFEEIVGVRRCLRLFCQHRESIQPGSSRKASESVAGVRCWRPPC